MLAVLMTLIASVFAPMSWAADAKVVLSKDHTDAFYITTETGAPVVNVDNGLQSRKYDPNKVEFQIQSDTYGKQYRLTGVSKSPSRVTTLAAKIPMDGSNLAGMLPVSRRTDSTHCASTSLLLPALARSISSETHPRGTRMASSAPSLPMAHIRSAKGHRYRSRVISMPTGSSPMPANTR